MDNLRAILKSSYIRQSIFNHVRSIHKQLKKNVMKYKDIINSGSLEKYIIYGLNKEFVQQLEYIIQNHHDIIKEVIKPRIISNNLVKGRLLLLQLFKSSSDQNNYTLFQYLWNLADRINLTIDIDENMLTTIDLISVAISLQPHEKETIEIALRSNSLSIWKCYNKACKSGRKEKVDKRLYHVIEYCQEKKIQLKIQNCLVSFEMLKVAIQDKFVVFGPTSLLELFVGYTFYGRMEELAYMINSKCIKPIHIGLSDLFKFKNRSNDAQEIEKQSPSLQTLQFLFANGYGIDEIFIGEDVFTVILEYGELEVVNYLIVNTEMYNKIKSRMVEMTSSNLLWTIDDIANPTIELVKWLMGHPEFDCRFLGVLGGCVVTGDYQLFDYLMGMEKYQKHLKKVIQFICKEESLSFAQHVVSNYRGIIMAMDKPLKIHFNEYFGFGQRGYLKCDKLMWRAVNIGCSYKVYEFIARKYPGWSTILFKNIESTSADDIRFFHDPRIPIDRFQLDKIDPEVADADVMMDLECNTDDLKDKIDSRDEENVLKCTHMTFFEVGYQVEKFKYLWYTNPDIRPIPLDLGYLEEELSLDVVKFIYSQEGNDPFFIQQDSLLNCKSRQILKFVISKIVDELFEPDIIFEEMIRRGWLDIADMVFEKVRESTENMNQYIGQVYMYEFINSETFDIGSADRPDKIIEFLESLTNEPLFSHTKVDRNIILNQYIRAFEIGSISLMSYFKKILDTMSPTKSN